MTRHSPARPYDIAMSPKLREQVRARRLDPDGEPRPVQKMARGNQVVQKYPWDKLLLGDFFVAKLLGCRYDTAANKMYQMARVRDIEIAVRRWEVDGEPGIRVTFVLAGIRELKIKARDHHNMKIPVHNRTAYLKRRAKEQQASYRRRRDKPAATPVPDAEPTKPPPKALILDPEAAVAKGDTETLDARAKLMALRKAAQNDDTGE